MPGYLPRRILAVLGAFVLATTASAGEVLSTMRNVNAVAEAHGFRLNMVHDAQIPQLSSDLSPAQAFEIIRPEGKPVTVGRLFTSCSCIQLESPKRTFGADERALLTLRNIKPTPPAGQVYAIFVQITSPVRTTLRFDTYVQSGMSGEMPFEGAASSVAPNATASAGIGTGIGSGALNDNNAVTAGAVIPKSSSGGYKGSPHANAVAALTRQIDQGFAAAQAQSSSGSATGAAPAKASSSPLDDDELDEAIAEARETAKTPAAKETEEALEADELPEPLPPPAELAARTAQTATVAERDLVAGTTAKIETIATPMSAQTTTGMIASTQLPDVGELEGEEEDEDDFNPLLSPVEPIQTTADQLTTRPRINSSSLQQEQGEVLLRTLTSEELERELRNEAEELYAREKGGALADQANLARSAHDDDDDLGTANLLDLRGVQYYEQQAGVQPVVQAPQQVLEQQQIMRQQAMGAAGDNLPPPPGLSTPGAFDDGALLSSSGEVVQAYPDAEVAYIPGREQPVYSQNAASPYGTGVNDIVRAEPRPEQEQAYSSVSRKPVQAVSLITVGVRDMPASIRFYEALGWRRAAQGKYDQTAFFQLQGQILALYPINDLLREQNMPGANPAPGGVTLALHVVEREDVWAVYQRFIDAGGRSLRAPAEMASGAVTSYVADPDGNAWEISWVPQFRIDEEGGLWLP